ncbi:hypothetical protein LAZ40_11340 [Cereibacter sphaeroides]|uniref:hypothetical protein n=1 Tax=Cereibacter sphaeroides TaxID=1063 RepID=UPI001F3FE33C|nr:hypothetical protein [Cereibacter sphaeroides]MCE6959627.1 hypothetical protein [Cereibacter sphaeroides]MCE6974512.1 hypothetical protein [Cereibacter sphaeroides]
MTKGPVAFREFLDAFYSVPDRMERHRMLEDEPPTTGDARRDAWLAACAVHLSRLTGMPSPDWTMQPGRYLDRPWFPIGLESMKATYICRSPSAFRERMIFVEEDPLYRPRRDVPFGSETFDEVSL